MTLVRSSLCRLRPMFNPNVSQVRNIGPNSIYGPPKHRASFLVSIEHVEILSFQSLHCDREQVELKRENEYIPIFKYILSFKDSSS